MPVAYRLQELVSVSTTTNQSVQDAVDNLQYSTLVIQVRKPVAAAVGSMTLQHAATLDEDAFVDISGVSFDLTSTATEVDEVTGILRYIRWSAAVTSGTSQFMIDIVARET